MIAQRKNEHLDLAADFKSQSVMTSDYDRVRLIHNALPEASLDEMNTQITLWDTQFSVPCMIGAMSGGTGRGDAMNESLVQAAEIANIPFALGSQRASLENGESQRHLRNLAPKAFIIGNLGGAQIVGDNGYDLALRAVADIEADALMIHLNPLQEAMQAEGNRDWRGVLNAIARLTSTFDIPVIVKEVGAGLSLEVIQRLYNVGVRTVETAGIGGTNWTRIESMRHRKDKNPLDCFLEWGVKTIDILLALQTKQSEFKDLSVIASGGVRHGLDCARAIWLGANICAMAQPFLLAALDKEQDDAIASILNLIDDTKQQIALTMFLTGNSDIVSFQKNAQGTILTT